MVRGEAASHLQMQVYFPVPAHNLPQDRTCTGRAIIIV
jgi:hypothetical protein